MKQKRNCNICPYNTQKLLSGAVFCKYGVCFWGELGTKKVKEDKTIKR